VNDRKDLFTYLDKTVLTIKGKKIKLAVFQNIPVNTIEMDPGQQILNIFANPTTAYVLFIIGAALIYFELQAPGGMISGAIGGIFLVLAGIGFQVLPLNVGAMGLIILSFILFVLEVYITSFGILTIAGLASLIFGSLFLFRTENSFIELEITVVFSVIAAITAYVAFISYYFIKTTNRDKSMFESKGEEAIVITCSEKENDIFKYQIKLHGEIWNATSDISFKVGDIVIVSQANKENLALRISSK
jgi:membrane-bound serine protease (ClpP class)